MAAEAAAKKRVRLPVRIVVRYGLIAVAACVALSGAIYASERIEQFLISDPRFLLSGPAEYGLESPNLEFHGVKFASRSHVLRVFTEDYGRSLYFFPLEDRRSALLNVKWVRDASIVRIWPNRLRIEIRERSPVAFVKLPAEGMSRWALIDDEGVILDPPPKAPFRLPVLTGVLGGETLEKRRARVRRMLQLVHELGSLADKVSEVDVSDLDNLRLTEDADGGPVTLLLGDRNFARRLQNFRQHFPDIHQKRPHTATFDLRLDDRITGLEGARHAR
jgi:cell division protein FtsQ